ncbi:MAG: neutral zinc metallopeptidase, partial [Planctomycetota bacterium]|nr:neutral zinc metallopeptidase [Planctomycetota bacterium]
MTGLKRSRFVAGHPRSGVGRVGLLLLVLAGFGGILGLFLLAGGNFGDLMRQLDENQGIGQGDRNGESDQVEIPGIPGELLVDAEPVFQKLAQKLEITYQPPQRSVFRNRVTTECFEFQSVAGPFYCFADERLYLEMDFFDELTIRFSETAELAQAYVIGRLMGKHLQTRMGITDRVRQREFDLKP